ncbi:DUF2973 domain-containing protein [Waterburya agarophytonicola K14]|uniref:DUF2973 domain-containing protein n=1 Tax=Waterburya agarophytonicola KI4 TaxID=2874699 RepID=A0A964BQK8_9CYAN|nr:DUF2973 domain-containing protein [Waterburya agarophytonicola]MCC0177037.1 DUF2973 domain-containing protein [Waterburya agarophytonicola KI4]
MLHLVYILVFTVIALLAVSNLIRSLITLSTETQKFYPPNYNSAINNRSRTPKKVHPELLDEQGQVIEEPLLVMRSVSVDDARSRLDALYEASPSKTIDPED